MVFISFLLMTSKKRAGLLNHHSQEPLRLMIHEDCASTRTLPVLLPWQQPIPIFAELESTYILKFRLNFLSLDPVA